jgi:hypothetical protein
MSTKLERWQGTLALLVLASAKKLLRILCAISAILPVSSVYGQPTPLADHHQHLFSPAITKLVSSLNPITASDVVSLLDAAGMKRAVVLSVAYMFGSPNRTVENEYDKVKAESKGHLTYGRSQTTERLDQ